MVFIQYKQQIKQWLIYENILLHMRKTMPILIEECDEWVKD